MQHRVLGVLKNSLIPLTAAEIADLLHLGSCRESQRRTVRSAVQCLRDEAGAWIIASLDFGYQLTDDPDLWRDYNEGRKIDAKKLIGKAHRQELVANSKGQGLLFGFSPSMD